jgi:IclR family acetate operon transcriptional repressor
MSTVSGPGVNTADGKRPAYAIESVDNVLRLLLMVAERKQIRVSEAAAELGTAVSTAHRLLAMLSHHSFVSQDPESKVYRAGPVLLRVGLLATRSMEIRTLVLPFIERLRDETAETAHAAVLQGSEMLFIACAESPNALRVASRVGTSMYAHCTSIGKAWLACESDDFLRGLYLWPKLPALTDNSVTSRSALMTELIEVRRQGHARNVEESELGVGSVSAAVREEGGRPVCAVSVSAPLVRMSKKRWVELAEGVTRTRDLIEASLLLGP